MLSLQRLHALKYAALAIAEVLLLKLKLALSWLNAKAGSTIVLDVGAEVVAEAAAEAALKSCCC